ncbi:MAG: SIR2 family protein [Rhodocyclales bacterium]|nr:SIR2 family protein [Rhodocyclales bacterium]
MMLGWLLASEFHPFESDLIRLSSITKFNTQILGQRKMLIRDLSDYPSIKKLASALHRLDASQHGAAIMIGAGFSRSAARHIGGDKKMPLWDSFTKKLIAELNPGETNWSFFDPLRIAEEYRAYFGQAALNDRIRSEIDNDAWRTGELYKSLLELPWSEVMTTNWDTLLERAAEGVHGPYYTPVTKPTDLTWASSPRIVKLHGTIGVTDTFVAAQEDYRTYPKKFAPFVNLARQVFIENELCLLGFSGDDPNFLHWAGWVRDHLADHARKIYLVGALKLTAARRTHLESINIAPIDLWDVVKHIDDRDLQHQTATELFLQAMSDEGKSKTMPHKWSPQKLHRTQITEADLSRGFKDHEYAATLLKGKLGTLQQNRESYPGWLICPSALRWEVKSQLSAPWPNAKNIASLPPAERAQLLYEISWQHSITFEYIAPWLADQLFEVANSDTTTGISKRQQMEIALALLKNSRWLDANNDAGKQAIQEHISALTALLEKHRQYLPDCAGELAYHQALVARDALDYASIEAVIENIAGEDPVWKLRQAALQMELGRFDDGRRLIMDAYRELQERYRYDQNSLGILSRMAWAHFLLKAATQYQTDEKIRALPPIVKDLYCDPWTWIEEIRAKVSKQQENYIKNQNPIEPLFEQGHYRDNSSQRSFSNETSAFLVLDGVTREVGIPLRSGSAFMNVNLLAGDAEKLLLAGGVGEELRDFTMALRAASSESSPSIKNFFTRIGVAKASHSAVNVTVSRILHAIDFWRQKRSHGTTDQQGHALSALRVLMEVLARLVVRVTSDKAKEIFRLAVTLGQQRDFQHIWLFDVFDSLLTNSLESVPRSEQGVLLIDALAFPLLSEPRWPNPVIDYPNSRDTYSSLERRIDELVELARPSEATSSAALLRLLPLCKKDGFLTKAEYEKLGHVLWGSSPTYQNIPHVANLFPHVFLFLPAPDGEKVRELVCRNLYEHNETILTDTQNELRRFPSPEIHQAIMIYGGMANAASGVSALLPSPEQALSLFDRLVVWRPVKNCDDNFYPENGERKRLLDSIGHALSYSIVPALSSTDKNKDRFENLRLFFKEIDDAICVMPALVYFVTIDVDIANSVEAMIRKSLQGRTSREVSFAAIAVHKWTELSEASDLPQVGRLIARLVDIIESGRVVGLQQLLWVSGELAKKKRLSEQQVATLTEAIPNVFGVNEYANINPHSQEAISVSSLREECVKLANTLVIQAPSSSSLKSLLDEAQNDALPEVRYALDVYT